MSYNPEFKLPQRPGDYARRSSRTFPSRNPQSSSSAGPSGHRFSDPYQSAFGSRDQSHQHSSAASNTRNHYTYRPPEVPNDEWDSSAPVVPYDAKKSHGKMNQYVNGVYKSLTALEDTCKQWDEEIQELGEKKKVLLKQVEDAQTKCTNQSIWIQEEARHRNTCKATMKEINCVTGEISTGVHRNQRSCHEVNAIITESKKKDFQGMGKDVSAVTKIARQTNWERMRKGFERKMDQIETHLQSEFEKRNEQHSASVIELEKIIGDNASVSEKEGLIKKLENAVKAKDDELMDVKARLEKIITEAVDAETKIKQDIAVLSSDFNQLQGKLLNEEEKMKCFELWLRQLETYDKDYSALINNLNSEKEKEAKRVEITRAAIELMTKELELLKLKEESMVSDNTQLKNCIAEMSSVEKELCELQQSMGWLKIGEGNFQEKVKWMAGMYSDNETAKAEECDLEEKVAKSESELQAITEYASGLKLRLDDVLQDSSHIMEAAVKKNMELKEEESTLKTLYDSVKCVADELMKEEKIKQERAESLEAEVVMLKEAVDKEKGNYEKRDQLLKCKEAELTQAQMSLEKVQTVLEEDRSRNTMLQSAVTETEKVLRKEREKTRVTKDDHAKVLTAIETGKTMEGAMAKLEEAKLNLQAKEHEEADIKALLQKAHENIKAMQEGVKAAGKDMKKAVAKLEKETKINRERMMDAMKHKEQLEEKEKKYRTMRELLEADASRAEEEYRLLQEDLCKFEEKGKNVDFGAGREVEDMRKDLAAATSSLQAYKATVEELRAVLKAKKQTLSMSMTSARQEWTKLMGESEKHIEDFKREREAELAKINVALEENKALVSRFADDEEMYKHQISRKEEEYQIAISNIVKKLEADKEAATKLKKEMGSHARSVKKIQKELAKTQDVFKNREVDLEGELESHEKIIADMKQLLMTKEGKIEELITSMGDVKMLAEEQKVAKEADFATKMSHASPKMTMFRSKILASPARAPTSKAVASPAMTQKPSYFLPSMTGSSTTAGASSQKGFVPLNIIQVIPKTKKDRGTTAPVKAARLLDSSEIKTEVTYDSDPDDNPPTTTPVFGDGNKKHIIPEGAPSKPKKARKQDLSGLQSFASLYPHGNIQKPVIPLQTTRRLPTFKDAQLFMKSLKKECSNEKKKSSREVNKNGQPIECITLDSD